MVSTLRCGRNPGSKQIFYTLFGDASLTSIHCKAENVILSCVPRSYSG